MNIVSLLCYTSLVTLIAAVPAFLYGMTCVSTQYKRVRQSQSDWKFNYSIGEFWIALVSMSLVVLYFLYMAQQLSMFNADYRVKEAFWAALAPPILVSQIFGILTFKFYAQADEWKSMSPALAVVYGAIVGPIVVVAYLVLLWAAMGVTRGST